LLQLGFFIIGIGCKTASKKPFIVYGGGFERALNLPTIDTAKNNFDSIIRSNTAVREMNEDVASESSIQFQPLQKMKSKIALRENQITELINKPKQKPFEKKSVLAFSVIIGTITILGISIYLFSILSAAGGPAVAMLLGLAISFWIVCFGLLISGILFRYKSNTNSQTVSAQI